jgi:hypothetical protein
LTLPSVWKRKIEEERTRLKRLLACYQAYQHFYKRNPRRHGKREQPIQYLKKSSPKLINYMNLYIQETPQNSNRVKLENSTPRYYEIQYLKYKNKRRILKTIRETCIASYKGSSFSKRRSPSSTVEARGQ